MSSSGDVCGQLRVNEVYELTNSIGDNAHHSVSNSIFADGICPFLSLLLGMRDEFSMARRALTQQINGDTCFGEHLARLLSH